jgi:hypothetical protein
LRSGIFETWTLESGFRYGNHGIRNRTCMYYSLHPLM